MIQRLWNCRLTAADTFYGVDSVNWVGNLRPVDDDPASELAHARAMIGSQDFASAAEAFERALKADLSADLRCEVQSNLAAALCALAQDARVDRNTALAYLDRARLLLVATLQHLDPLAAPREWASARANLALVYLGRQRLSDSNNDVLLAHLALDGTEDALSRVNDVELLGWIKAIRDHLTDVKDRRGRRR